VGHFEGAEADELDRLALFQTAFDTFDDGLHGAFRLGLAHIFTEKSLDGLNEFCLVHE
jgi:hypothetical protein